MEPPSYEPDPRAQKSFIPAVVDRPQSIFNAKNEFLRRRSQGMPRFSPAEVYKRPRASRSKACHASNAPSDSSNVYTFYFECPQRLQQWIRVERGECLSVGYRHGIKHFTLSTPASF